MTHFSKAETKKKLVLLICLLNLPLQVYKTFSVASVLQFHVTELKKLFYFIFVPSVSMYSVPHSFCTCKKKLIKLSASLKKKFCHFTIPVEYLLFKNKKI